MLVDDVYDFLKATQRTRTHAQFSVDYLGMGSRYYDYLRSSGGKPNTVSLIKLAMRLTRIMKAGLGQPTNETKVAALLSKRCWDAALDGCQ
jgi:hypothetical protein